MNYVRGTTQFILMSSLASVDSSDTSQFKRNVVGQLTAYKSKRSKDPIRIATVCTALESVKGRIDWAIPPLLGAAEVAIRQGGDFELLTNALLKVGQGDERVIRFYERAAKEGPEARRLYCDSIAKKLKLSAMP
jgi:hypothetical protein